MPDLTEKAVKARVIRAFRETRRALGRSTTSITAYCRKRRIYGIRGSVTSCPLANVYNAMLRRVFPRLLTISQVYPAEVQWVRCKVGSYWFRFDNRVCDISFMNKFDTGHINVLVKDTSE